MAEHNHEAVGLYTLNVSDNHLSALSEHLGNLTYLQMLDVGHNACADDIFAYAADPEVAQYTLWSAHTSTEESRRFIAWLTSGSVACWALVYPDTRHVIGTSVLHSYHLQHQRAEIAFNLAKAFWGQGYATEAARAVIRAGFMHYSLNRIEGTCMLGNVASAWVMEKVGMHFEGILRQYVYAKHAFHDMKLYAILRAATVARSAGTRSGRRCSTRRTLLGWTPASDRTSGPSTRARRNSKPPMGAKSSPRAILTAI